MRLAGFLAGAGLATVAVIGFKYLSTTSDDDLLITVLTGHCLPYATDGVEPFAGLGRTPGVYDDLAFADTLEDGGARILFDNRFVAHWGITQTQDSSAVRVCTVVPSYARSDDHGFAVARDSFIATITQAIGTDHLTPQTGALSNGPRSVGWYEDPATPNSGLRIVLVAQPGLVSRVLVAQDLND